MTSIARTPNCAAARTDSRKKRCIVAPAEPEGTETARFRAFLNERGEGVYSVVVRTAEIDGPIKAIAPYGASVRYRQHRETGDIVVDEADLTPVLGMSITLLATNLDD